MPWRDGGKHKRKRPRWRHQAAHAVDDPTELRGELVGLALGCPYGRSPAQTIYLFDQRFAGTGIRYYAELHNNPFRPVFSLIVPAEKAAIVVAIIAQLQTW